MDLVVDANILFASLIKKGTTADLLFIDSFHLYAPEFLLEEFVKYKSLLLEKTERTDEDFEMFLDILKRRITFIPKEEIEPILGDAEKISPDPEDSPYFALAILISGSIWTNDKRLKNQEKVPVYTTKELLDLIR